MRLARSYNIGKALDIDCKKSTHRVCSMTEQIRGPSQPDHKRHIKDPPPCEVTVSSTMSVLDKSTIRHPENSWTPYIVDVNEVTASGTALADTPVVGPVRTLEDLDHP